MKQIEIQFRVWHSELKIMHSFNLIDLSIRGQFTLKEWSDADVMHYTRLKDKNDYFMYESDIVRANDVYGSYIGYIVWWEDRWALTFKGIDGITPQFQSLMTVRNPEVIGNIYETPELLK